MVLSNHIMTIALYQLIVCEWDGRYIVFGRQREDSLGRLSIVQRASTGLDKWLTQGTKLAKGIPLGALLASKRSGPVVVFAEGTTSNGNLPNLSR